MKKNILFALLFVSVFANGQNAQTIIDSLKLVLKSGNDHKKTASIYSDLTWYYSNISIDSALHYGGKAIKESQKAGDSVVLAQVYSDVGAVYFRTGDFIKSKSNYLKAYAIRKARKDYNGLAKININLASIYASNQQYNKAMAAYFEAVKYFESIGNENIANNTKVNIGYVFMDMKNYPKAIKYMLEGIRYEEKNNLPERLCVSCLNIGRAYLESKDTLKALSYYNKSLKNCKIAGNQKGISSAYNNVGSIISAQKKSREAMQLFQKAASVRDQLNSDIDNATLKINIADEYIKLRNYKAALALLTEIKKVFQKNHTDDNLLLTYKSLVPVYAHLNQPDSATYYSDAYAALKERLVSASVLKQTAELEAKYQTEKKEKLLIQKEAEAKQKNILLFTVSILAFFTIVIALLIFRQQKLKNKQQAQEHELKTAIAQIETQNKLQEQRLSISRDLHDNIGAQLTFIISSVDNIKYAFDLQNSKLDNKLQNISNFTKSTILELRDTIWAMNNNEITFEDLRVRILNFIDKAKEARENIDFHFNIDSQLDQFKLSSIAGMNIYRMIQESVNNAIKYSVASEIAISGMLIDDDIRITIRDNGKGFDKSIIEKGNGLLNMEKRIEDIGGIFNLTSEIGVGTTITALIKTKENSQL